MLFVYFTSPIGETWEKSLALLKQVELKMAYLSFIKDADFLSAIGNLFNAYKSAANEKDLTQFYANKVDIFKFLFDKYFFNKTDKEIIENEVQRQVDKSVNNAIGTFHEEILGHIKGYERGNFSGWDIRALDDTLFADIKNKFNTMNSSSTEALYQKLERLAKKYPKSTCYWVAILCKRSYNEQWTENFGNRTYNHPRVRKISGDKFYALLSGKENALAELYEALPKAISDYLSSLKEEERKIKYQVIGQLQSSLFGENTIDIMAKDNYPYYSGFSEL